MGGEEPEEKTKELRPAPNDEFLPNLVDEITVESILIRRSKESNDPTHNIALRSYSVSFKVLTDFWVEEGQQSLKLIHFKFESLELVGKDLAESGLHQMLEDSIARLLIF